MTTTRATALPSSRNESKAWLSAAFAVCVVGWGANQFVPMLLWYEEALRLSTATVQLTFGMYAAGLIPGLLLGGPLSDRTGRKAVLGPALGLSLFATVVLIAGQHGLGWLFAGRVIAGIASGVMFSAGSAWVKELSTEARAGSGARRATVAMTVGFGLGPLVAGVLAQWAPAPGVLPYLPHLALGVAAVALMWRAPETCGTGRGAVLAAPRVRSTRHPRFLRMVIPLAPWVFASASIAFAYLPGLVVARLSGSAIVFSALITLLTALAGILVQPLARKIDRADTPRLLVAGLSMVVVGLLVAAAAAVAAEPILVVVVALILGAGYGVCLVCGLLEVQRLSASADLASTTAVYQAWSYLGLTAPYLLATLHTVVPPPVVLLGTSALAAGTLVYAVRSARRTSVSSVRND